jgi:hypothetical protein
MAILIPARHAGPTAGTNHELPDRLKPALPASGAEFLRLQPWPLRRRQFNIP